MKYGSWHEKWWSILIVAQKKLQNFTQRSRELSGSYRTTHEMSKVSEPICISMQNTSLLIKNYVNSSSESFINYSNVYIFPLNNIFQTRKPFCKSGLREKLCYATDIFWEAEVLRKFSMLTQFCLYAAERQAPAMSCWGWRNR